MLKLYQRIQMNTMIHFEEVLPATAAEWQAGRKKESFFVL
jgi:hypothetical protein